MRRQLLRSLATVGLTAAAGFALSDASVEGNRDGLFFLGRSGRQVNPWGTAPASIATSLSDSLEFVAAP